MNTHSIANSAGTATLTITLELAYTDARALTADALECLRTRALPSLDFAEERDLISRDLEEAIYEVLDLPALTAGSESPRGAVIRR